MLLEAEVVERIMNERYRFLQPIAKRKTFVTGALQRQWKSIPPVTEKIKNSMYFTAVSTLTSVAFEKTQDTLILEPKSDFFKYFTSEN